MWFLSNYIVVSVFILFYVFDFHFTKQILFLQVHSWMQSAVWGLTMLPLDIMQMLFIHMRIKWISLLSQNYHRTRYPYGIHFYVCSPGKYFCTLIGSKVILKLQVKDQTYFLSHLSQSQLKRLIFPLGCISKVCCNYYFALLNWHLVLSVYSITSLYVI